MKKSDLKNGMEVMLRNGKFRLFFKDNLYIIDKVNCELEKTTSISQYSDELTNWDKDWDIIRVYYEGELIWERPKVDWTKVPFGTKVRAWWDCDEERKIEGKFLAYDEYSDGELPFYILPIGDGLVEANWFDYCEVIQEDEKE